MNERAAAKVAVDVLVPVYNGARYIRSSIESLQNQSLSNIRIQVVDDGSTDASGEILAAMAAEDPRIRIHWKPNGGIVEALNAGLVHCRAEFLARHDADDLAYPSRLAEQVRFLTENPDVIAVAGRARHIDSEGRPLGTMAEFHDPERADPGRIPAREPYLLHPFLMLRRTAIERIGGYRHVVHAEDVDLYWRLAALGRLVNQPLLQGEYRMHRESLSSRSIQAGRVMSVSSQLCALSALRRLEGQDDLVFTHAGGEGLKAGAGSMEQACRSVEDQLSTAEALRLRFAAGVKLLHLAGYRPYELEPSDCEFLKQALAASGSAVIGENRKSVLDSYAGAAARLAVAGRWREASLLVTPEIRGPFALRLLLRLLLPAKLHRAAQKTYRSFAFAMNTAPARGAHPASNQTEPAR